MAGVVGGQTAPDAFLEYFGPQRRSEVLRNVVVRHLWRLAWHARRAVRDGTAVLVTTPETEKLAVRMGAKRIAIVGADGIEPDLAPSAPPVRGERDHVRALWLGRFLERKGLGLAVEAVERLPAESDVVLEVLGGAYNERNEREMQRYFAAPERSRRIVVSPREPYDEIGRVYERADIFVFTGIRVPVTEPAATVAALTDAIARLAASPELRRSLGEAAFRRAREFTWDKKAAKVLAAMGCSEEPRPAPGDVPNQRGRG